jgi:hypothetical protein
MRLRTALESVTEFTAMPLDHSTLPLLVMIRRSACLLFMMALQACTGTADRSAAGKTARDSAGVSIETQPPKALRPGEEQRKECSLR